MLQQPPDRCRFECDDTLVERSAAAWIERDGKSALLRIAGKLDECRIGGKCGGCGRAPLGSRAEIERVSAFDDGESHRTRAGELNDQTAVELQRRGYQRGPRTKLGKRARQRRRIRMACKNAARRPVEGDKCAPYFCSVEHEACQRIGGPRS